MSADATNSSKRKMDCGRVAREEILESYLTGRLSEEDREPFEEHYFECAGCFNDLRALQAIQRELRLGGAEFEAQKRHPFFQWIPVAGLSVVGVLVLAGQWVLRVIQRQLRRTRH
jgi:Putative zinc-finger